MGKLAFAQQMTEEVPFRYAARLYRNRGAKQIAGDLFRLAALRQSTYHGPAGPISLKTVHRTVFQALDAPKGKAREPPPGRSSGAVVPMLMVASPKGFPYGEAGICAAND